MRRSVGLVRWDWFGGIGSVGVTGQRFFGCQGSKFGGYAWSARRGATTGRGESRKTQKTSSGVSKFDVGFHDPSTAFPHEVEVVGVQIRVVCGTKQREISEVG